MNPHSVQHFPLVWKDSLPEKLTDPPMTIATICNFHVVLAILPKILHQPVKPYWETLWKEIKALRISLYYI